MSERSPEPMFTKEEWMERLNGALDVVAHRQLLVQADSLLSLVVYRGAGAADEKWKADALALVLQIRKLTERRETR